MIKIKDLHVSVNGKQILKGLNLTVKEGEIHAVMGPNGAGKSTLANVISGKPGYEVTSGQILFEGKEILLWEPEDRALAGIFLAFQYPVEIPGVSTSNFLKTALNAKRKAEGKMELDAFEFFTLTKSKTDQVNMDQSLLKRSLNEGFSGGEKKRNEILQLLMLDPKLAILDETDSGLDIDALKTVSAGVNFFKKPDNAVILVTHYQRLLNHIVPDFVHVLMDGKIVKSAGKELALKLEEHGYDWIKEELEQTVD